MEPDFLQGSLHGAFSFCEFFATILKIMKRLIILTLIQVLSSLSLAVTPVATQLTKPSIDRVISKVVGELGTTKYFVTSREVQINYFLEQLLEQMNGSKKAIKMIQLQDNDFANHTSEVLLEWIIYKEASSFETELTNGDIQKELKYVQEKVKTYAAWASLDVTREEEKQFLERKILVKRFMRLKSDSSKIPVSDAEAEVYFKKNRNKFGSLPFESFRENIRVFLQNSQTEQRLKNWYEVLNRKYKVRNFIAG
jgi:hypothetical protein